MSAGTELWLIRHGETEWSVSGQHTSRRDIALTDHGRKRAEELRDYLAGMKFRAVLVGPMQRGRETCRMCGCGDVAGVDGGCGEGGLGMGKMAVRGGLGGAGALRVVDGVGAGEEVAGDAGDGGEGSGFGAEELEGHEAGGDGGVGCAGEDGYEAHGGQQRWRQRENG